LIAEMADITLGIAQTGWFPGVTSKGNTPWQAIR
jgi:hypothetical protein